MDNLEFLDGAEAPNGEAAPEVEAVVETPAETTAVEAAAEEPKGPVRGPDGKFARKEADEPVMVPLKALHETRDEVRSLKAQLDALNRPQVQQQPQVPDMFEDPDGYQAHIASTIQQSVFNQTLNISEEMTRQAVGGELVDQATEWARQVFSANPAAHQIFASQRNPYGWLVGEYQRQVAMSQIGSDPKQIEAFIAWQQAQQAQPQPAAQAAQPQPQRPTGSIATAVSAGGAQHTATGPGVAFDNTIG